eukprot:TRINITY_DN463_c1_g2_i1.p1 TRINITY_DN463_c1_g2~~TRINITY_DN463_c1_g2_i1.p1  ORF type:complete len:495 (+),score=84.84 TRINITY_DN463_c1_g2_i1:145-1629(+)
MSGCGHRRYVERGLFLVVVAGLLLVLLRADGGVNYNDGHGLGEVEDPAHNDEQQQEHQQQQLLSRRLLELDNNSEPVRHLHASTQRHLMNIAAGRGSGSSPHMSEANDLEERLHEAGKVARETVAAAAKVVQEVEAHHVPTSFDTHRVGRGRAPIITFPLHPAVVTNVTADNSGYCTLSDDLRTQQQLPEVRRIIYYKTHKTGSSTIGNILYRFGAYRRLRFLMTPDHYLNVKNDKQMIDDGPAQISLHHHHVHGHWRAAMDWYRRYVPGGVFLTIVRDPVKRYISHWNFFSRPVGGSPSLEGFTNSRKNTNYMCHDFGVNNEEDLKSFIAEGFDEFPIMLILDRMAESLLAMKRLYHWRLTEDILHLKNLDSCRPGQKRWDGKLLKCPPKKESLDSDLLHKIESANSMDMRIYEEANRRLDAIIASQGPGFQEELREFEATLSALSGFCAADRKHPRCAPYVMGDLVYEECINKASGYGDSLMACSKTDLNLT